jgi:NADH dehydrogenase
MTTPPSPAAGVVAVTGATGFVGRSVCDHFRRLGWEVRALVRDPAQYPYREPGVRSFRCDLPDGADEQGLAGAGVVVHCAYVTRFTSYAEAERVNDQGTRRLLALAKAAGVGRFVFISTQAAHAEALSYYGKSKFALERLVLGEGGLVIRPGFVLGPGDVGLFRRVCDMIRTAKVIPLFGGGRQPMQFVHIDDLCQTITRAVTAGRTGRYTVAGPRVVETGQFFRMLAARLGRRPWFVSFPIGPALLVLRLIEALRLPFPVSSENLLGFKGARADDTRADLEALGVQLRDVDECLDGVLGGRGGANPTDVPATLDRRDGMTS